MQRPARRHRAHRIDARPASSSEDEQHLAEFIDTREGVEGFVEPRTAVSDVTLLLVARDGEFTRRRVPSADWAYKFCKRRGITAYEAGVVGIPQRMREYIKPAEATEAPLSARA